MAKMTEVDLALLPMEDLIREIESRCKSFIMAYEFPDTEKTNMFDTWFGSGRWSDAVKLASVLQNDCLNNWSGELRTLQRINEEGDCG